MRAKKREISEKYKIIRLPSDSVYNSRLIHTFLNKFILKGKKALARRHTTKALVRYRQGIRRPQLFFSLLRVFYSLRLQFILVQRRQARKWYSVPTPIRRNKRDVLSLQTLYRAIIGQRERTLSERVCLELRTLTSQPRASSTLRNKNSHLAQVYEERVNMERR